MGCTLAQPGEYDGLTRPCAAAMGPYVELLNHLFSLLLSVKRLKAIS